MGALGAEVGARGRRDAARPSPSGFGELPRRRSPRSRAASARRRWPATRRWSARSSSPARPPATRSPRRYWRRRGALRHGDVHAPIVGIGSCRATVERVGAPIVISRCAPARPAVHGALAGALRRRAPGAPGRSRSRWWRGAGSPGSTRCCCSTARSAPRCSPHCPRLRRSPVAWAVDFVRDARARRRLRRLAQPVLPAVARQPRAARPPTCRCASAGWLGVGAPARLPAGRDLRRPRPRPSAARPRPRRWRSTSRCRSCSSPRSPTSARRCGGCRDERSQRERLAIEAERKRIAWELHDSAKQRLHAAHLLVTSLHGPRPRAARRDRSRAAVELESAASDMDTSLAELRSPLEGRRLDEALRERADELAPDGHPRITVLGARARRCRRWSARTPTGSAREALTNALRHADAPSIEIAHRRATRSRLRLRIVRRRPRAARAAPPGASGLLAMENRAATIGRAGSPSAPAADGDGTLDRTRHPPRTRTEAPHDPRRRHRRPPRAARRPAHRARKPSPASSTPARATATRRASGRCCTASSPTSSCSTTTCPRATASSSATGSSSTSRRPA